MHSGHDCEWVYMCVQAQIWKKKLSVISLLLSFNSEQMKQISLVKTSYP